MQSDTTGSLQEFHKILEEAGKKGASDIHYVPKEQLLLRIDGRLVDMTEEWNVSFSMEELIEKLLDKKQQKTFEENGEVEFSCPVFNKRVRVNLFRQSGTCAMSVRLFAEKIPTPQMLGLPESAVQMAGKRRGLILVTGASGSGRTTTMASMIDHIASNYERSILTLEKPAEYLFRSGKSMVLQREIGIDSRSYIVVLDYGAGKTYKAQTYFLLHNIQNWNDLEAVDLTGDGVQELAVQHCYNKTIQYGAYRVNRETEELREIYSTLLSEEAGRYREEDGFKGTLLDDYKVKLEFPDIGYSETISMIKDAGYKEEELQTEKRMYEDGSYNFVALWKDGTLKGHGTVFLYTMDSVDYIKNKDGSVWVDFAWTLAVDHRSCDIGTMHVYYEYDKAKDTLVLAGAKYEEMDQAMKKWEE